ncbi:MAG: hypothetical protein JWM89_3384 [Acidimicrobiales bacterium]|nr:hypothetical protein [Acidimicrobiales bacterium]
MIVTLVGLAVLQGVLVAIRAAGVHRAAATSEVVVRNFSEALVDAPYVPCARPADYQAPSGYALPSGYEADVTSVQRWTGDPADAGFEAFPTACDGLTIGATDDTMLQRISFDIRSPAPATGLTSMRRHLTVLKSFDGNLSRSDLLPAGAVRCTITGDSVSDTSIDQAHPGATAGSAETMNVSHSGTAEQDALLRFDVTADATRCRGPNDTVSKLPATSERMVVLRSQLRLYSWRISGAPTCPDQCTHVLERATAPWTEATASWSSAPTVLAPGRSLFTHPADKGDYSPRFEYVSDASLTADVQSFYSNPSAADRNYGWRLTEACSPTYLGRTCATQPPGFQFRTKEWKETEQRPALEVILVPQTTTTVQIRNVAFGSCASVKDDAGDVAASLIALSCNGKGYQGWTYDSGTKQFKTVASTDTVLGRQCIDTQEARQNPRLGPSLWTCDPAKLWQQLRIVGSAIQVTQKVNNAAINQCLEIEGGKRLIGTRLIVNDCNGSPQQQWAVEVQQGAPPPATYAVRLRNTKGNSCLDIEAGKADKPPYWTDVSSGVGKSTSRAEQFPCFGGSRDSGEWLLDGYDRIVNDRDQTACLDAGNGDDRDSVGVNYCNNGTRQQWGVEVQGDHYRIRVAATGNCLEGGYDAYRVRVRTCSDAEQRQWWAIEPSTAPATVSRGWLRNEGNFNTCLEPEKDKQPDQGNPWMWAWPCSSDRPNQEFLRLRVSDTEVQYRPVSNPAYCLDWSGGGDNQWSISYLCNVRDPGDASSASDSQRGVLQPVADLSQTVTSDPTPRQVKLAQGGRCLQVVTGTDGADYARAKGCISDPASVALPYQRWYFEQVGLLHQQTVQFRSAMRTDSGCAMPYDGLANNGSGTLTSWPCSGALRPKQAFVRLTNGQIRLSPEIYRCLDSTSNTTGSKPYFNNTCGTQYQQRWKYTDLGNGKVWIRLQDYSMCLRAGLDMAPVTLAPCDINNAANINDSALAWTLQDAGTNADPRIGHVRNVDSANCLEPVPGGAFADKRKLWDWPCAGNTRPFQQFVQLNTGQLRAASDTRYCLDDLGALATSTTNSAVLWSCDDTAPTSQVWGQDSAGARSLVIPSGATTASGRPIGLLRSSRMATQGAKSCVREILGSEQAVGSPLRNGDYALTRSDCTVGPTRQAWAFEDLAAQSVTLKQVRSGFRPDSGCVEPKTVTDDRSSLWTWPCAGSGRPAQALTFTSDGQIKNSQNGNFCFDARNVALNDVPYYSDCHGGSNQKWTRVPVAGASPFVQLQVADNRNGAICLQADLDATLMKLAACNAASAAQRFVVEDAGTTLTTRYVKIRNLGSGRCMQPDGPVDDGRSVWAWECDGPVTSNVVFLATNNRQLHAVGKLDSCLDYNYGSAGPDRNLAFRPCQDQDVRVSTKSQLWTLTAAGLLVNDRDPTKCTREIPANAKPAPFNVGDYSFVTDCVAATDPRDARQRWAFDVVANP